MVQTEIQEMATKRKTFKQFISPDLQDVTDKDLEDAKKYLNPDKTPEEKKKMN
jgi:hypothetical protein